MYDDDGDGRYDVGIVDDALTFMALGLEPGGCTLRIILNDIEGARARCHHHGLGVFDNTFRAARHVLSGITFASPDYVRAWQEHSGLYGADASLAVQIKLNDYETYEEIMGFIKKHRKD